MAGLVAEEARVEANHGLVEQRTAWTGKGTGNRALLDMSSASRGYRAAWSCDSASNGSASLAILSPMHSVRWSEDRCRSPTGGGGRC